MTIPAVSKDQALNAITIDTASLHTAFPGLTGVNEVTGGTPAYARKAVTFSASSGGSRTLASAVAFDVPATTIRWIGFWAGSVFKDCAPNGGGTPRNFIAVPATDTIYSTSHGYTDGTKATFFGMPPAPLVEGTVYFVRDSTTDSFKVASTSGGAALDITAGSSFGCVVVGITEDVYSTQGTHTLSTASIGVPD